ncbi:hypothetical protein VP01_182g4 [Puccinia sorghi]|uniref:Rrn7/TAF1B N-terminal cyclin domain-containing protein n=1 Tax=Puccinia sorghi TaxID=27349 RepID=A0A0L6VDW1_9BASI|nr:hypothetical protein VP01_182g4 [Puccinia sorghi]
MSSTAHSFRTTRRFSQTTPSQSTVRSTPNPKKHQSCPRCGSRKWRRDPNRGVVVCAEGHVLEGFLRESTERTELSQHSLRRRRLTAAPRKRKSYIPKPAYQDQRARVLLVQALTLLIRKQIEALIQVINLPIQLEEVARNLWKAYISALNLDDHSFSQNRSASPVIPSSRFGDDSQSECGSSPESSHLTPRQAGPHPTPSQPESNPSKSKLTPEALKAITQEHSESSDPSSDDSAASSASSHSTRPQNPNGKSDKSIQPRRKRNRAQIDNIKVHPRMVVTICTIYLACLKLRLPIILQDLINLITTKQVPHIGFIHCIPSEVQKKMNRPVMQSLSAEVGHKNLRAYFLVKIIQTDWCTSVVNYCRFFTTQVLRSCCPKILLPTCPSLFYVFQKFYFYQETYPCNILLLFLSSFPDPLQLLALHLVRRLDKYFLTLSPVSFGSRKMKSTATQEDDEQGPGMFKSSKALNYFRIQMAKYPPDWFIMAVVFIVAQSAIVATSSMDSSGSSSDDDSDASSTAKNAKTPDPMFRLVTGATADPNQWYRDLTQTIKQDEDKKPQTLWEKNLTELDPKEIDSYIAFAKDFLLNDQPEPIDLTVKNQFFPLSVSSRSDMNVNSTMQEEGGGRTEPARAAGGRQGNRSPLGDESEERQGNHPGVAPIKREWLTQLMFIQAAETIGCSVSNHSHLDEFLRTYTFVNSFLSKTL